MLYLVDDAADYRFLVQQIFALFLPQYPLHLFDDGLSLIQHTETHSSCLPNLIILDVDMPKLDGFQTMTRLKQKPHWENVPIVLMSNRTDPDFVQTAQTLGARQYIHKPTDMLALRTELDRLCHTWLDT